MSPPVFEQTGIAGAHLVQIAADIENIEKELLNLTKSPVRLVQDVCQHTLESGGKRLRPAFLILSARATGCKFEHQRAILLGACMELIHMATLIHDDVIDETATRRGRASASVVYGNTGSILSGDVLLAKAMKILAQDGDLAIIRTAAEMVIEMAEGEAREVEVRNRLDLTQEEHEEILRLKTASFLSCCCRIGALMAGAPPAIVESASSYGLHLGLAFQIADDLLDYLGDPAKTGKPRATDFREGCATYPLILGKDALSPELKAKFGAEVSDGELAQLISALEPAFEETRKVAATHLEQASYALSQLPDSAHRDLLAEAGKYVIRRSS